MRFVNYEKNGRIEPGIVRGENVLRLTSLGYRDDLHFISEGQLSVDKAKDALSSSHAEFVPLDTVKIVAPVLRPSKILCVGLNYRDHAMESKMEIPAVPTVFLKLPNAVTGPDAPILLPRQSTQPDYEAELAVVIGKYGKNIAAKDWADYVFGYTILNDVSARDVQLATSQWILGKSFDSFAPLGPWVVTKDEIPDPHCLDIQLSIDGEILQHSNTRELIFRLPELIEYISAIIPLEPGDILSTGTPAGVGLGRTPKRWLRPAEQVVIEIEKIGTLRNHTIAENS